MTQLKSYFQQVGVCMSVVMGIAWTSADGSVIEPVWDGSLSVADTHVYLPTDMPSGGMGRGYTGGRRHSYYRAYAVYLFPIAGLAPGQWDFHLTIASNPTGRRSPDRDVVPSVVHQVSLRLQPDDGQVTFGDFYTLSETLDADAANKGYLALWEMYSETGTSDRFPPFKSSTVEVEPIRYVIADSAAGTVLRSSPMLGEQLNQLIEAGHSHVIVTVEMTQGSGNTSFAMTEHDMYPSAQIVNVIPEPGTAALLGVGLATLGTIQRRRYQVNSCLIANDPVCLSQVFDESRC